MWMSVSRWVGERERESVCVSECGCKCMADDCCRLLADRCPSQFVDWGQRQPRRLYHHTFSVDWLTQISSLTAALNWWTNRRHYRLLRLLLDRTTVSTTSLYYTHSLQCKVKVKMHTLDIAPLCSESPTQKRSGMTRVLKGFHTFTCTPTRSSAIGMSHTCLCLPSYSWYSFTDPGGMEGWVGLGGVEGASGIALQCKLGTCHAAQYICTP